MREILVLRAEDEFSRRLAAGGFAVINCPVIATEPLHDLSGLQRALSSPVAVDGLFVTSAAAAAVLAGCIGKTEFKGRVFVLGERSFEILKNTGSEVFFNEAATSAAEMLDAIGMARLAGKRFLFVRGERSLRSIPERLVGVADIEDAVVYRTRDVIVDDAQKQDIRNRAAAGSIAMTCFFSPSGAQSFAMQIGADILGRTKVAAIGRTTADALRAFGVEPDVVGQRPQEFAECVIAYLQPHVKEPK